MKAANCICVIHFDGINHAHFNREIMMEVDQEMFKKREEE